LFMLYSFGVRQYGRNQRNWHNNKCLGEILTKRLK
jgi:hypothetical protein